MVIRIANLQSNVKMGIKTIHLKIYIYKNSMKKRSSSPFQGITCLDKKVGHMQHNNLKHPVCLGVISLLIKEIIGGHFWKLCPCEESSPTDGMSLMLLV